VFLDKITGPQTYADTQPLSYMGRFIYAPPGWEQVARPDSPALGLVQRARVWEWKLDAALGRKSSVESTAVLRTLALRALMNTPQNQVPPQLLERWRWQSQWWVGQDREAWRAAMEQGREAFFELNPNARHLEW
jgi:hypothetical protein